MEVDVLTLLRKRPRGVGAGELAIRYGDVAEDLAQLLRLGLVRVQGVLYGYGAGQQVRWIWRPVMDPAQQVLNSAAEVPCFTSSRKEATGQAASSYSRQEYEKQRRRRQHRYTPTPEERAGYMSPPWEN